MAGNKPKDKAASVGQSSPIKDKVEGVSAHVGGATIDGQPVFDKVILDPETGDLLDYELTEEVQEQVREKALDALRSALELVSDDDSSPTAKELRDALKGFRQASGELLTTLINKQPHVNDLSAAVKQITNSLMTEETREALRSISAELQDVKDAITEIEELTPYIKSELKKPEYNGVTLDDLLKQYTPIQLTALPEDSDLYLILEKARAARLAAQIVEPYKADKLDFAVDRVNLFAWDLTDTHGQIKFDMAKSGTHDVASTLFALSFDDDDSIKFTKEINHFDKRIHAVVGTAYEQGAKYITLTGIHYNMGNTRRPSAAQLKKINDSLTKQGAGRVFIDNRIEAEAYNYPRFKYDDSLLHFRRVTAEVDGKITDGAIQILEEPALMAFARQRKQISAVPMKVLQSPVSKTNNHMQIEDYLLWRIVRQKNELNELQEKQSKKYNRERQHKINEKRTLTVLLKTFYERTGYSKKDATSKKRARDTARDYLKHYQSKQAGEYISKFEIQKDRIIITLPLKK